MADDDKKPKQKPIYHVVTVEGDTLTVIRPNVQAATQFAAMDAVMEERPETLRAGKLGAFLANSLRFKDYTTRTETKTDSVEVEHTFGQNGVQPEPEAKQPELTA